MTVTVTLANNPAPPGATSGTGMSVGGLFTLTGVEDSLTAHAGGTKAAALALSATKNFHRVSVCATEGDSVLLPAATVGQSHFVRNDGAAPMKVYGAGTDTIDDIATATGVQQQHGTGAYYDCLTAGKWSTTGLIEAGSFTPVVTGGTVPGTGTYPAGGQKGRYVKNGKQVNFNLLLIWTAHDGTGNLYVTGLPYADEAISPAPPVSITAYQLTFSGQLAGFVDGSKIDLLRMADGAAWQFVQMDVSCPELRISGSYTSA